MKHPIVSSAAAALLLALCVWTRAGVAGSVDGPGLRRVPYDAARPPTLVCSTKFGCEVILEPGERLRIASIFDDRWTAKVADDGATGMAPRVLIGPTIADEDSGHGAARQPLRTSLKMLTTKREYVVELVSTAAYQEHRLGFTYRDAPGVFVRIETPPPLVAPAPSPRPDEASALDPSTMDFGWRASGDPAVRCVGTPFSIGNQVWCKLPENLNEKPAAYKLDGKKLVPVPFHFVATRYIVIDATVSPIELVLGGSQEHVATIVRARE
jgi:hypothetical protein